MEAYKLFAKDVYNSFCTKKTFGIWIGFFHCMLFGSASLGFSVWAIYGIFDSYNSSYYYYSDALQNFNSRDAFFYFYLTFCLIMFVFSIVFIRGVQKSNLRKLVPFLLTTFVGIITVSVFMANIQYAYINIEMVNGICISLLVMHIISFFWVLTRCLFLRYTPEKLFENIDDGDKLLM